MAPPQASLLVTRRGSHSHVPSPAHFRPSGSLSHVPSPTKADSRVGAEVQVGQHKFCLNSPLGSGSFSTVWSATSKDGRREVAVKETLCRSPEEVKTAEQESRIIQMASRAAHRIPEFIACETTASAQGTSVVRLAMTKVHGQSLDTFLSRWKTQGISNQSVHAVERHFEDACNFTRELLLQMVPDFEAMSGMILHRDVNTHNVLVNAGAGASNPQFSLIDFGLATEIQTWPSQMTSVPVVGDSRYWPASAWLIFTYGGQKLMEDQSLMMEYRSQLDLHALGISAVQVFFEMVVQPASPAAAGHIPQEVWMLKSAWDQYWQDAYKFSEPLYQAFQNKIDFDSVRRHYINCEAYRVIARDLVQLRHALGKVCGACARAEPGTHLFGAGPMFSAMLELISDGGNTKVASWASVRSILNGQQQATLSGSGSMGALGDPAQFRQGSKGRPSPQFRQPSKGNTSETGKSCRFGRQVSMPQMPSMSNVADALQVLLADKVAPAHANNLRKTCVVGNFRGALPQPVMTAPVGPFRRWGP